MKPVVYLASLLAGLLFGIGLILSGMANPAKVLAFLDIFGTWDPSLLFVMLGAISVGFVAFSFGKKKTASLIGEPLRLPTARHIDKRLSWPGADIVVHRHQAAGIRRRHAGWHDDI